MKRWIIVGVMVAGMLSSFTPATSSALGLKVAPLEYKATLKENEKKQGFIDVSNPSSKPVLVGISVQAFKQIDDDGGLQFYDDELISAGIKPDLPSVELGPREAARVFFTIDSKALPEGDVFAAVFFTTDPKQPQNGVGQLVRVGTILSLVNKNPGSRKAEITAFSLPIVQLTSQVSGTYRVKNTGPEGSGFYPTVEVSSWPGGKKKQVESSLVFGGRERSNDFKYDLGYGIHRVEAVYGSSSKSQWIISVAPWMLVATMLVIAVIGIELLLLKRRRKSHTPSPLKK